VLFAHASNTFFDIVGMPLNLAGINTYVFAGARGVPATVRISMLLSLGAGALWQCWRSPSAIEFISA